MDPRFRSASVEIVIVIMAFAFIFNSGLVRFDLANPVWLVLVALLLAELVRIMYKFHKLRKEGVDIAAQEYRSPLADSVSPQLGDAAAKANRVRIYLILGFTLLVVVIYLIGALHLF